MHVLLIGGYKLFVKALKQGLEEEGFTVDVAYDSQEANSAVSTVDYDAIILDLVRFAEAGGSLLEHLRRAGLKTRVLALTAPGGLDGSGRRAGMGADDCLTTPFGMEELLARLRALAGDTCAAKAPALGDDDFGVDAANFLRKDRLWCICTAH